MCESIMNKNEVVLTFYDEDCLEKKKQSKNNSLKQLGYNFSLNFYKKE